MPALDTCLTRFRGRRVSQFWGAVAGDYLEFLAGRCRPNTVLAAAYDRRVFFTVVARPPARSVRRMYWGSSLLSAPVVSVSTPWCSF
jgi:hypothetical protein